ncbi:MAG: AAA family ATPase [Bosea sp. (in: a-proteobacteria)]|nr:AAA family ATPase [Bosea sp. (in: a-proteobacteria)]
MTTRKSKRQEAYAVLAEIEPGDTKPVPIDLTNSTSTSSAEAENLAFSVGDGTHIAIFDRDALHRQLRLGGVHDSYDSTAVPLSTSQEEQARLERLRTLSFEDPKRSLLIGKTEMHAALAALRDECPAFMQVIDLVDRAVHLSRMAGTGLSLPPIVLVGAPGLGKTHFSKRLAAALGSEQHAFSCATNSDAQALVVGHPVSWKGARMGVLTEALLGGETANPLIVLDELDKLVTHATEKPFHTLLALLEPENASALVDEYLRVPFDVSHALILATANDLDALPEFIRDRLLVIDVRAPSGLGLLAVTRRIAQQIIAAHRDVFEHPDDAVIIRLARAHPRRIRRILTLALGHAAAAGRTRIQVGDIDAAEQVAAEAPAAMPIGFLQHHHA